MKFWVILICLIVISCNVFALSSNDYDLLKSVEKYDSTMDSRIKVGWAIDLKKNDTKKQEGQKIKKQKYINVLDFGVDTKGQVDATKSIQKAIDFASTLKDNSVVVLFPEGRYLLSKEIHLRSNVSLQGKESTIYGKSWKSFGSFFLVDNNISNIDISGFIFDGNGQLSKSEFKNPYFVNGGVFTEKSNGFSNNHVGIYLIHGASDIVIKNNVFKGLGLGVYSKGNNIYIDNNLFYNMGLCAIRIEKASYNFVKNNKIDKVYGGMNTVLNASYDAKSFADGIYIYISNNILVFNNEISQCRRIGVVVEGDGKILNENILIMHNLIRDIRDSVGNEFNSAVWVEGGRIKYNSVIVIDNNIKSIGGLNNKKYSYGVFACDSIVYGNDISKIYGVAVFSKNSTILKNNIHNLYDNGYQDIGAIFIKWQDSDNDITYIHENKIINTDIPALFVFSGMGRVLVHDNLFVQNGNDITGYMCSSFVVFNVKNNEKIEFFNNTIEKYNKDKYKKCTVGYVFSLVVNLKGSASYPVFSRNKIITNHISKLIKLNAVFYGNNEFSAFDFVK